MLRICKGRDKLKTSLAALAVALVATLAAPPAEAEEERPCVPAAKGETFVVDFDAVELETVARLVSCAAEIAILYSPPTLRGRTLSVLAPRPVDVRALVALFRSALVDAGLVMERRGAYHLIRAAEGGGGTPRRQVPSKRRSSQGR